MSDNKILNSIKMSDSTQIKWATIARTAPKSKDNINKKLKENLNNDVKISCSDTINKDLHISESKENLEISCDNINKDLHISESKKNLEISCIIPELEKKCNTITSELENINEDLKISCNTITFELKENIDSINSKKHEIEYIIKKVCIDNATIVKNAFMTAYNIIKPKDAKLIAEEEYQKTYNLFYSKLSTKYELEGINIKIIDIIEYKLTDDNDKINTLNNENNLPIYQVNNIHDQINTVNNEKNLPVNNEKNLPVNNEKNLSIFQVNNTQEQLNIIARNFAKNIIINQEINNKTHLEINCENTILGYINNKPIFPNKFLDPTYVKESTFHTASHHFFKKEFFNILKQHLGDNHNLHVKFSKDLNNNMIFHIHFVNRIIKNKFI